MVIVRADKHSAFTFEQIRAEMFGKPVDDHSWIKSVSRRSSFKTIGFKQVAFLAFFPEKMENTALFRITFNFS